MPSYLERRWGWTVAKTMESLGWKTSAAMVGKFTPTVVAAVGGFVSAPSTDLGIRTAVVLAWVAAGNLVALALLLAYHWWVSPAEMDAEREKEIEGLKAQISASLPDASAAKIAALERRLEMLHQPYGLSTSEARTLLESLQRDRGAIFISRDVEASDADFFYTQVVDAFKHADWVVNGGVVFGIDDPPDCGVTLYRYADVSKDLTKLIASALGAAGITFEERDAKNPTVLSVPHLAFSRRNSRWHPPARWA